MKRFSRTLLGVIGAVALVCTGCANDAEELGGGSANSNEPIVIGGTLGLTGTFSGPSAAYKAAYEYWAGQVNASGGLLKRKVQLKIYDDESDPTTAQQLYQRLINEDQVDLLLAPYTTAVGGAVVPTTERAGKVLWNAGFVSQQLHSSSKLLVSSWTYQEPEYPRPFFDYLKSLPADKRPRSLAVATAQNPFTIVARDGFKGSGGVLNYAKQLGLKVVFNEEYNQQATDLTSLIQQAKASRAEVFVGLGLPNDAALMAKTVRQVDFRPSYYCQCGSQVVTLPNWKDLGAAGQNVFSTTTAWPGQPGHPDLDRLYAYFKQRLGYQIMPAYGAGGLAILQVLQQAVEGTKGLDQQKLRRYVAENQFQTAVGTLKYNPDGTAQFAALLVQQQNGAQVVWPKDAATAEPIAPFRS
jgi:branched-chain amino acid transport system substrate-binding protein